MRFGIIEFRRPETAAFSTASAHSVTRTNRTGDFFDIRDAGGLNGT